MTFTRIKLLAVSALLAAINSTHASEMIDPVLTKVMVDSLEWRAGDHENLTVWDVQAWVGKDLNKLWLKTDGEMTSDETESASAQLLYSRAVAPYWDAQIGWRRDFEPGPAQDWLAIGLHGLAPYFFETELALFVDDEGNTQVDLSAEREWMLTQKWVLSPEIELTANGQNDDQRQQGSGLASLEVSLRLSYEIRREFAPYVGIVRERTFGNTADYRRAEGEVTGETFWVMGVRGWF
jgi:copper resistance protein B